MPKEGVCLNFKHLRFIVTEKSLTIVSSLFQKMKIHNLNIKLLRTDTQQVTKTDKKVKQ